MNGVLPNGPPPFAGGAELPASFLGNQRDSTTTHGTGKALPLESKKGEKQQQAMNDNAGASGLLVLLLLPMTAVVVQEMKAIRGIGRH